MSDKPRPWPNFAKEARVRSAEEAAHIVNCLVVLIDGGRDLQRCRADKESGERVACCKSDPETAGGKWCANQTIGATYADHHFNFPAAEECLEA